MNTTGIQHTCVRHLYVRCPRAVSRPPHPQLPRTESGKLPSQFVPRGRDDRKGKDTPGRRDNTSVLRDKKSEVVWFMGRKRESFDHNVPRSLTSSFRPLTAIEGFEGT